MRHFHAVVVHSDGKEMTKKRNARAKLLFCFKSLFFFLRNSRCLRRRRCLDPVYMEWGTPVKWRWFLLFCVPQSVKTQESNPTRPGSPTPCKQGLKFPIYNRLLPGLMR